MIDTIKIAIWRDFNKTIYDALLNNSHNKTNGFMINSMTGIVERQEIWRMKMHQYENHEMMIVNGKMKAPSFNYHISYRCFEDRIELEFSLPKFIYGTNVLELTNHAFKNKSPYDMLVLSLKRFFDYYFALHKVDYGGISLMRWDFCYNQVFSSRDDALKVLEYIKMKNNRRKDTRNYNTGFVELTSSKYLKIYHKGEEFVKHDFYKLERYQENFKKMADNILRYEKKITPSNIAYWYNVHVRHGDQKHIPDSDYQKYLDAKNGKRKMFKWLRQEFEGVPKFTLGSPSRRLGDYNGRKVPVQMAGYVKLDSHVFNHLYNIFRDEIKKKFEVGKMSIDALQGEVLDKDNKKNKTMKVRILALIKSFGSLERAVEKGALSDTTAWRYKKFMEEKNMSTTRKSVNVKQDWTSKPYFRELIRCAIPVQQITKDLNF